MVPELETLVGVYRLFYREELACLCDGDNKHPNLVDENGDPMVCPLHEWEHQRSAMRKMLDRSGISLPIPCTQRTTAATKRLIGNLASEPVLLAGKPKIATYTLPVDERHTAGQTALNMAHWLDSRGHIVVRMDRTHVITQTFEGREAYMRDALMYAPVLVFWDNPDGRNGTWIESTIQSRQYGLAVVLKGG